MNSKNPKADQYVKKKRRRERSDESKADSTTSRDSREGLECDEKEPVDPFRSEREFSEKAHLMAADDWVGACVTLMAQIEKHSEAIEKVRLSDRFCARCEELSAWAMATATHQLGKAQYALREYSRRYPQVLRDLDSERGDKERLAKENKEWLEKVETVIKESEEGENCLRTMAEEEKKEAEERLRRMAEEKREAEAERDQLRAALAARGESEEKG